MMMEIPRTMTRLDWETPQGLFDELNNEFAFDLDVCATPENAKCNNYYTPEIDGLKQEWSGVCWMNPPYGREIVNWIRKAHKEATKPNTTVVCLVPAKTDTMWWHDYCIKGEVRFIKGRLRFVGAKYNAPFPSAIVIFGQEDTDA